MVKNLFDSQFYNKMQTQCTIPNSQQEKECERFEMEIKWTPKLNSQMCQMTQTKQRKCC